MNTLFSEWTNKHFKKLSKMTKFVINLPKIMRKEKKVQKIILIMIEIGQKLKIKKFSFHALCTMLLTFFVLALQ